MKSSNNVAIILARGGSKSIPKKNIVDFCGKPLIAWSIEQAKNVRNIQDVWVSSDNEKNSIHLKKIWCKNYTATKKTSNKYIEFGFWMVTCHR